MRWFAIAVPRLRVRRCQNMTKGSTKLDLWRMTKTLRKCFFFFFFDTSIMICVSFKNVLRRVDDKRTSTKDGQGKFWTIMRCCCPFLLPHWLHVWANVDGHFLLYLLSLLQRVGRRQNLKIRLLPKVAEWLIRLFSHSSIVIAEGQDPRDTSPRSSRFIRNSSNSTTEIISFSTLEGSGLLGNSGKTGKQQPCYIMKAFKLVNWLRISWEWQNGTYTDKKNRIRTMRRNILHMENFYNKHSGPSKCFELEHNLV